MKITQVQGFFNLKTHNLTTKNNKKYDNTDLSRSFENLSDWSLSFGELRKTELNNNAKVRRRLVSPEMLQSIDDTLESYKNTLSNAKQMHQNLYDKLHYIDDMVDQFDVFTKNDVNKWLEEYDITLDDNIKGNLKVQKDAYWFAEGNPDDESCPSRQILGYDKENNKINCYVEDHTQYNEDFIPISKENKNYIYTYPKSNSAAYCEGRTEAFDSAIGASERMLHFNIYTGLLSDYAENVKFFTAEADETYTAATAKLIFMPSRNLSAMYHCINTREDSNGLFSEKVIEFCEDSNGKVAPKYYYENLYRPNHVNYKEIYALKAERLDDGCWVVLEDNIPKE